MNTLKDHPSPTLPESPQGCTPQDIALGGRDVTVMMAGGDLETVRVRLVPIAEYGAMLALVEKPEAFAAFLIDRPLAEVRAFPPGSIMEITEAGLDLNFDSARRWLEQRVRVGKAALKFPEMTEAFETAVAKALKPTGSASSAPTSA